MKSGNDFVATVWELENVPPFKEYWAYGMYPWKMVYKGYYAPWHEIPAPTIKHPLNKRQISRLSPAKAVCSQIARYVWDERCEIRVSGQNPKIEEFVHFVLNKNNFNGKLGELYETACALGGCAVKEWCEDKDVGSLTRMEYDDAGNAVGERQCEIKLSYHMADQFIPTQWDNAKIYGGLFISRELRNGFYFTRVERQEWHGKTLRITNEVFRLGKDERDDLIQRYGYESQDILGYRFPLEEAFEALSPAVTVENIGESLFTYIRVAGANNLDDNSPLGMSVYGNAMDTLRAVDYAYDGLCQEVKLGRKRIIVPARAVKEITVTDPITGNTRRERYFDADDEAYEALNFDNAEDMQVHDNSLAVRVTEFTDAINAQLSILCVQTGMDAGILSFDKEKGLKTATEVISENSKTYAMVKANQNLLRDSVIRIVRGIVDLAKGYGVMYDGTPVAEMGDYEVNVTFDDSIVQDTDANINRAVLLLSNGLISKKEIMTNPKYGIGLTEEQADEMLKVIADEQATVTTATMDMFNTFTSEG